MMGSFYPVKKTEEQANGLVILLSEKLITSVIPVITKENLLRSKLNEPVYSGL